MKQLRFKQLTKAALIGMGLALLISAGCASPEEKIARHQAEGDRYMEEEQYRQAVIEYRNVIQLNPQSSTAHTRLGTALLKMGSAGNVKGAFVSFSQAVKLEPSNLEAQLEITRFLIAARQYPAARTSVEALLTHHPDHPEGRLLYAGILANLEEVEQSRTLYLALLEEDPKSWNAHFGLGMLLTGQKEYKQAETHLKQAIESSQTAAPRLSLSRLYLIQQRVDDAQNVLKEAIKAVPESIPAYLQLSRLHLVDQHPEQAKKVLSNLITALPEQPVGYRHLGDLHRHLGEIEQAEKIYLQGTGQASPADDLHIQLAALRLRKDAIEAVEAQAESLRTGADNAWLAAFLDGQVALQKKEIKMAITHFEQAINDRPGMPLAHTYLGRAHLLAGNINSAKEQLKLAVEGAGSLLPAHLDLARIYLREGNLDDAKTELITITRLAPNLPDTLFLTGLAAMAERKPKAALEAFERLVSVRPDHPEGHLQLGRVHLILGHPGAAKKSLERALEIAPEQIQALELLVREALSRMAPEQAEQRIRAHMEKHPGSARAHHLLGQVLQIRGQQEAATAEYEAALKADDSYLPAYAALGNIYLGNKDSDRAVQNLNAILERDPAQPRARMLLGVLHEQKGETDAAIAAYQETLKHNPRFAPAANNLAWLYAHGNGNLDVALGLAQTAREVDPNDPGTADTLGWIYYLKGAYLKAQGLLDEALEKMPDHPVVNYHAGMTQLKRNHPERAREYLTRALATGGDFPGRDKAEQALAGLTEP